MKIKRNNRPTMIDTYVDREGLGRGDRERHGCGGGAFGTGLHAISSGCSWLDRLPTADEQARGYRDEEV